MATHSSILAWRIPRAEELDRLQSWGCEELYMTEGLTRSLFMLIHRHIFTLVDAIDNGTIWAWVRLFWLVLHPEVILFLQK